MSNRALIEGIGMRVIPGDKQRRPSAADLQAAIEAAGREYKRRFGRPATHVALPSDNTIALSALKLWTLSLGHPAGPGVVIVGHAANGTEHFISSSSSSSVDRGRISPPAGKMRGPGLEEVEEVGRIEE